MTNSHVFKGSIISSLLAVALFASTGIASAATVYDAIPNPLAPNYPSQPFQAQQTSEFGDYVHLAAGPNRILQNVTVTMSDWAVASTQANIDFCAANVSNCDSTGYFWPITVNVYGTHLDGSGAPDTVLATKTVTTHIPWRAEADITCADPSAWRAGDGNCYGGAVSNATFDLSSLNVSLPNDVIVGFVYNTETYGPTPTGVDGPYDSLNIAVPPSNAVTVGTDADTDGVFWNTSLASNYTIAGSTGVFRQDTGWTPYGTVAMQITAGPSPVIDTTSSTGYPTIQAAIDAASSGDVITVAAGNYQENVNINKSLTLQGAYFGVVGTSTSRVSESTIDGNGATTLSINASNVTIDGFTVKGGGGTSDGSGIVIAPAESNVTIANNVITDNQIGVYANCSSNCVVQRNEFKSNNRTGAAPGVAIYTDQGSHGLTIDSNDFTGHLNNSAIIFASLVAGTNTNAAVTNNTIENNNSGNSMIYVVDLTGGTFTGNTISGGSSAIKFASADSNITVTHNILTGNVYGVRVIDGTTDGLPFTAISSNISVNNNEINGNSTAQVANEGGYTGTLNATSNWWGTVNPTVIATSVSGDVSYNPWLCSADQNGQTTTTGTCIDPNAGNGSSGNTGGGGNNGAPAGGGGGGGAGATALPNNGSTAGAANSSGGSTAGSADGQVLGAATFNFSADFGVGASGTDVTELQKVLIAEGFLTIDAPTGTFGPLTKAALMKYQKAHGITPVTGYVGPKTLAVLNAGSTPTSSDEQKALILQNLQQQLQHLLDLIAALHATTTTQ